ncbi:MAG: arsenic resistance protein [Pseudodesulfovibrio sp.]|uniref:arsenic resistance protein n=1 Tax=Pseudodesulfovibrio sp. TaxID=2035812 RepID=UPI003D124695
MSLFKFINRYMIQLLLLTVVTGLAVGYVYPDLGKTLQPLYPVCLFVMLYPMMIGIKIGEVAGAARKLGFLTVALVLNYLLSPLAAAALAHFFLGAHPDFAVGLILTGVVPCAGMIVAWTGMAGGNMPLALLVTVVSLLAGILLIPVWMLKLAGIYVAVDAFSMFKTILIAIVIPLILGNLTRIGLVKWKGQKAFMEFKPIFPAVSALGMYSVFFISMSAEAATLFAHPEYVLIIAAPLILLYVLLFFTGILCAYFMKMNYADMVALTYGVGGKNISIALALAVLFFSPLTVMIIAVKPLIQVLFMAGFFKFASRIKDRWDVSFVRQRQTEHS